MAKGLSSKIEQTLAEWLVGAIHHEQRMRGDGPFTTDCAEWRMTSVYLDILVDYHTGSKRALPDYSQKGE
jgi:hypothetical protein